MFTSQAVLSQRMAPFLFVNVSKIGVSFLAQKETCNFDVFVV